MSDTQQGVPPRPAGDFARVLGGLSWTLLGELTFAAAQFGLLICLARIGPDAALGRYALGLAIATPLMVLSSLHLRPAYVVESSKMYRFADYFGLRLIGAPLACVFAVAWSVAAGHDQATVLVVTVVALIRLSELIADICHAAALREERMKRVGLSRALRGALLLGTSATLLALGQSEAIALGGAAVAAAALTLFYDVPTARRFADARPRFDPRLMRSLIVLTAPVGLAGGLLGLTMNTPVYVLEQVAKGGVEEVGRYAAVVSVMFVSGVINAAVGSAAVPRLARLFESSRPVFRRLVVRVGAVVLAGGICVFLGCQWFGELYLRLAYGPSYVDLVPQLRFVGVVVIGAGVANLLSQTLVSMRYFRLQFAINVVTLAAAVILSLLLIPSASTSGVAHAAIDAAVSVLAALTAIRLVIYCATITWLSRSST